VQVEGQQRRVGLVVEQRRVGERAGVTMRDTARSIGPLVAPGSPTCSAITTDSPSLTSRARYCSTAWCGTPAILIGWPADAPRVVSVMSISRAAFSASSKNSS
jgi:hypothetical protein